MKTRVQRRRLGSTAATVGIVGILLGWALTGSAGAAAVVSCDDDPACRPIASRAREFSKAGQLDDALLSYQAAYRITPDPRIVFNIARIQHKQNKLSDALDSYRKFCDTKFEDENLRSKAQEYIAQIQAAQAAEPPPATLNPLATTAVSDGKVDTMAGAASKPVYKKAWFWVLIGGLAAAGIAGGVAGGVIASQQPPSAPDLVPTFHLFQ